MSPENSKNIVESGYMCNTGNSILSLEIGLLWLFLVGFYIVISRGIMQLMGKFCQKFFWS